MRSGRWLESRTFGRGKRTFAHDEFVPIVDEALSARATSLGVEAQSPKLVELFGRAGIITPGPAELTGYSLTASSSSVTEGGQVVFTITRSGDKPAETIYFSTLSDGTATYGEGDYSTTSGGSPANIAVTFSSGTTSRTVTLNILNDGVSDSGEQFRAIVQRNSSDPVSTYLDRSSYVTINDAGQNTSYSLSPSSTTVTEGNQVTFTITRSGDKPAETIYFSTLSDGTATYAEGDYTTTSGGQPANIAVSFSSGTTSRTVTLNIVNDGVSDSGEQFRAIVQRNSSDPVSTYLDRSSFVTINDVAQGTTYSLTPSVTSVVEGNQVTFTITRSGDKPAETVYFSTLSDGTATYAEGDYTTTSGGQPANIAVSFSSGTTSRTVTLNIISDGVSDSGEQFRAIVQRNSSDPVSTYLDRSSYVTINDPAAQNTTYSLMPASTSVTEGGQLVFTITRSGDKPGETVYFSTLADGTATYAEGDYTTTSGGQPANVAVVFGTGVTSQTVTLNIVNDGESDSGEQFRAIVQRNSSDPVATYLDRSDFVTINDAGAPPPVADDFRDDATDTSAPLGNLTLGNPILGFIGPADANDTFGDKDVFGVSLTAGQTYDFRLRSNTVNGSALPAGVFTIRDDNFTQLEISGSGSDEHEIFTADRTGLFYIRVGSGGASGDTGGYRLEVNPVQPSQVPDDWADEPNDAGVAGGLSPGGERTGIIETAGDKDYFTVTLVAGKVYHFSVEAEDRPGAGAIGTLAMSLRGPNNFNTSYRGYDDGLTRTGFDFQVTQGGTYYLRVGAGDDGGDTGGYRVSVGMPRTPTPPPPPLPPLPPQPTPTDYALHAGAWVNNVVASFDTKKFDIYLDNEIWDVLKTTLRNSSDETSLAIIEDFVHKFRYLKLSIDFAVVANRINNAEDWREALFVETVDWFVGSLFHGGGTVVGAFLGAVAGAIAGQGALSGPLGGIGYALGSLVGGVAGDWVYTQFYRTGVRQDADIAYDGIDDATIPNSPSGGHSGSQGPQEITSPPSGAQYFDYGETLVAIDETWYLSQYPDAAAAISAGLVGGVYAHFLTIGIDLGYQPNAHDIVTRNDLAYGILNNDPNAINHAVLFAQILGGLGGDGVSQAEQLVANALAGGPGVAQNAILDADMSALAHRKALDLAINVPGDTIAAAAATSSGWALLWSDGSDFDQVFATDLEALLGAGAADTAYRVFVTASATGSAADVLARFQAQQGWSGGGFDTFGIAEFGGHWVLIVADRAPGAIVVTPGNDTLASASIYGSGIDETIYAGLRAGRLFGLDGNDVLVGGAQDDLLNGGAGIDNMTGGLGDDTYFVDNAADWIVEGAGDGASDRIFARVSYGLAPGVYVEILSTDSDTGTAPIALAGNELDNIIRGNAGSNVLYGLGGNDELTGLGGDDSYVVDTALDRVIEFADGGYDTIYTYVSYTLTADTHVEALSTASHGATDAINLTGNGLNNTLFGNAGANILNGAGGNDAMVGLDGNDIYYVDAAGDQVFEAAGGGNDTVYAYVSYTLAPGTHVEALSTANHGATTAINLTGNSFNNTLFGNAGANVLHGAGGNDSLVGLAGDDIYYVDTQYDLVFEAAGGGNDAIYAGASYTLAYGVEVETLSTDNHAGTAAINLTGNSLAQTIIGNAGANVLIGGGGNDFMTGFAGDDIYYIDVAGVGVAEAAGGGNDAIYAGISYVLAGGVHVETLSTNNHASTAAINLTGNSLAQTIIGNAGANVLIGGGGADFLNGLGGNDAYYVDVAAAQVFEVAGGGNDTVYTSVSYVLAAAANVENLSTMSHAASSAINLTGNGLNNTLFGNNGANVLDGKGGNDSLVGLAGADTFAFTTALAASNIDQIFGFEAGLDKIAIDDAIFAGLGLGTLSASAFRAGASAQDADDRIVYNSASGQLFFDADGNGAGAAVQFAIIQTGLNLAASDFTVI